MSPSRLFVAGIALAALAIGIALGSRLGSGGPDPAQPQTATGEASEVERLERELDHERGRRGALELELALLRREIASAPDPTATQPDGPTPATGAPTGATQDEDAADEPKSAASADATAHKPRKEWFDTDKLVALGVDERHGEWLRERFESLQMEELYLRDQATRERWLNRPRYSREVRALQDETRAAIGEEDYDRMLFGAGRHNRVLLSDVLRSSPAADAGIQAGDVLVRYGDRAIYDVRDVLAETSSGEPGETAAVDVLRDGEVLRFFVERGPLGARIQPLTHPPAALP